MLSFWIFNIYSTVLEQYSTIQYSIFKVQYSTVIKEVHYIMFLLHV